MEVRCCCEANKLIGTLPVPDAARLGQTINFPVMKERTRVASAAVLRRPPSKPQSISMPIHAIVYFPTLSDRGDAYAALAADGVAIEVLRRVPGFIEAVAATGG
jgi:hypothetical protein